MLLLCPALKAAVTFSPEADNRCLFQEEGCLSGDNSADLCLGTPRGQRWRVPTTSPGRRGLCQQGKVCGTGGKSGPKKGRIGVVLQQDVLAIRQGWRRHSRIEAHEVTAWAGSGPHGAAGWGKGTGSRHTRMVLGTCGVRIWAPPRGYPSLVPILWGVPAPPAAGGCSQLPRSHK